MKPLEKRIEALEMSCDRHTDQEEIPECVMEIFERVRQKAAECGYQSEKDTEEHEGKI